MIDRDASNERLSPELAEAFAAYEEAVQPDQWAVYTTCDLGTESVNGVYADPISALAAAETLAGELAGIDPQAHWSVRLVPYFAPCGNSAQRALSPDSSRG